MTFKNALLSALTASVMLTAACNGNPETEASVEPAGTTAPTTPAKEARPGMKPEPGADGGIVFTSPEPDAGPAQVAPDAGGPAVVDAGVPVVIAPVVDVGTLPTPDAGIPPKPDAGTPAKPDAGAPVVVAPKPDAGTPAPQYTRDWVVSPSGNDNHAGTAAAPLQTITRALALVGPGERVLVKSGTYDERLRIGGVVRSGTSSQRIMLEGEGRPKLVSSAGDWMLLSIERPYWTVKGFDIDGQSRAQYGVAFIGDNQGSLLTGSEVHRGAHGAGVTFFGSSNGARVENNDIHDFKKVNDDSHGVLIQHTARNVSIRNNSIHDNSGDSIQCLGPEDEGGTTPADGVLIEGNDLFRSAEQAIDIKTCYNVTVRGNRMHLFRYDPVRGGNAAMVIHYSPRNVIVEENDFYDSGLAVGVGGNHVGPVASGVIIRNNLIHDMITTGGMTGGGLKIDGSDGTLIYNNTLTRLPGPGLLLGSGNGGATTNLKVKNNLVADGTPLVSLGTSLPGALFDGNLYSPSGTLNGGTFAAWKAAGRDPSGVQADPLLNPDTLTPGAAAVDRGLNIGLPFCGSAPDIGAVETGC